MSLLLAHALILLGAAAAQEGPLGQEQASHGSVVAPALVDPRLDDLRLESEAQDRRIESLFEGALVGVRDAEDFSETPGYRQMLEKLSFYGEEELRQKAGRHLDVAQALADPDAWRGEIVRVHSLVAGQNAVRLARPLNDHVDVFRAFLTEADGSEGVVVDFLEYPPPFEIQEDVVEVEGVFFRTVRYENKKGAFVEAPYLIARGIRRLDVDALPRQTAFDGMAKILIGLAVAFLVIRILLSMRKKRPDPSASLAARKLRERARAPLQPKPRTSPEPRT